MPFLLSVAIFGFITPAVAYAVEAPGTFSELVALFVDLFRTLTLFIFALAFIFVAWNLIRLWIIGGGDEESVKKGKYAVTVGVVVLVIMSGVLGILELLRAGLFGL
jgi:succinate dehydrogenase/fumarate reductase cytochrome b subunit